MSGIKITAMLKDGGYKVLQLTAQQLGKLAASIHSNGSEWVTLQSGSIQVVGFILSGKLSGERIVVLGGKED